MAAIFQWRKFNFFDVKNNVDGGKLAEVIKDVKVTCTSSGRGVLCLGDSSGSVHIITRQFAVTSFQAHTQPIKVLAAFDHTSTIITVADGSSGPSEVKVWAPDRPDPQGVPLCLRTIRPDPSPNPQGGARSGGARIPSITALAVHPNQALLAIGFANGAVMLYRGEVGRERGSKHRVVITASSGVTSLHIRHTSRAVHLFVTTHTHVYCINCSTRDKETTIELDNVGCAPGCSTLADGRQEHQFLVARPDAIYSYTTDSRGSCYVFEGDKSQVECFRGYLIVATCEKGPTANRFTDTSITVYDLTNKLIALSTRVKTLAGIVSEWGGLYVVTQDPVILYFSEKDLQSKFELLFKKNQFDIAISLAKTQCCDQEEVVEILRQYGDWLYSKGDHAAAMDQYIKTIPHLEPSYIIKKFLDTQRIHNLTTYLQALHKSGTATEDHTGLLLNCYTRLRDTEQLDAFIMSKNGGVDFDVELGVRVCRGAGYFDHALAVAARHGLHTHYLSILLEDKQDYQAALRYISTLEFEQAKDNVLRYGNVLLLHAPDETTELLIKLCTDYKPLNTPVIKEGSLDTYLTPDEPVYGDPEEFEYLLVGHSDQAITFLEHLTTIPGRLSARLHTTLLAEYLHQYTLGPEGHEQESLGKKILDLLRNTASGYNTDHALLLCDKHQFHKGKLLLWEQAGMYEELLSWHAERGDINSVVEICNRHNHHQPKLWSKALHHLTDPALPSPPNPSLLSSVLSKIEQGNLLPPLEVVDRLASSPHITLGQVREYLVGVLSAHSVTLNEENERTAQYAKETEEMRETISNIRSSATQFTGTKCNICNNELELPSVHFLCRHSFHHHCFESYSENDAECPICSPENKKMLEIIKAQETHRGQHDQFHEQLDRSSDSFSVIADYLGRGVFTHLHTLEALFPSLNTTRDSETLSRMKATQAEQVSSLDRTDPNKTGVGAEARMRLAEHVPFGKEGVVVPESEGRLRALEKRNPGPVGVGGEGRLRFNERRNQGPLPATSESQLHSDIKSSVLHTTSEGRMRGDISSNILNTTSESRIRADGQSRVMSPSSEARLRASIPPSSGTHTPESRMRGAESQRSSVSPTQSTQGSTGSNKGSLHDHIIESPSGHVPSKANGGQQTMESISASLSNMQVTQPSKTNNIDNPFEKSIGADGTNPFGDDFETEESIDNPFEESVVDSKNPFAEESESNPFNEDESNPFKEDMSKGSDDYDSKLNPFGES
ncbi:vacuolar protein sorting 11 isoform X2 [Oratosquilla oratoria]|uniref:vacuolar protein sorting 11 isoform X2 n=1 Tax=Oratosquilla oratoria TaxID=337810 RepID=UPI003F765C1F